MPIIQGGTVIAGSKPQILWLSVLPTDAVVTANGWTPANGQLAGNLTNGNIYERAAGVWNRIDTL